MTKHSLPMPMQSLGWAQDLHEGSRSISAALWATSNASCAAGVEWPSPPEPMEILQMGRGIQLWHVSTAKRGGSRLSGRTRDL